MHSLQLNEPLPFLPLNSFQKKGIELGHVLKNLSASYSGHTNANIVMTLQKPDGDSCCRWSTRHPFHNTQIQGHCEQIWSFDYYTDDGFEYKRIKLNVNWPIRSPRSRVWSKCIVMSCFRNHNELQHMHRAMSTNLFSGGKIHILGIVLVPLYGLSWATLLEWAHWC